MINRYDARWSSDFTVYVFSQQSEITDEAVESETKRERETRSSAVIEMMICGDGRKGMSNNKKRKNGSRTDSKETIHGTL